MSIGIFFNVRPRGRTRERTGVRDAIEVKQRHATGQLEIRINPQQFTITPIPGKILVFRTRNGNLAKVEILSYYRDNPSQLDMESESRYYTFNYLYNPNDGEDSLE